jgi:60S ribosome subunit biogenesis protein NIP7
MNWSDPLTHFASHRLLVQHRTLVHRLVQVWVRPSAEMQFLYGNHVLKSGLGRITEGTPAYTGVVRCYTSWSTATCPQLPCVH